MAAPVRSQFWMICLGHFFEHYDTALFSFLSPFLAPLIFPQKDPLTALILTYMIIPLGMLARPLGSLFFSYIGNIYGQRRVLFLTLTGMSFVSGCIAFSPTYVQVGLVAPILFCLGRALQNFFAAGEVMGGAIFLLENSPEKHHDLLSSLYSASMIGGYLLASLGVFFMSHFHVIDPGWRFLYLFGCITALFGCLIRKSPSSARSPTSSVQTLIHLKSLFWTHRRALLFIAVGSGFSYATYSIALVLMNGFIPLISTLSKTELMKINTYLLLLDFCALPLFGWIASRFSREKLMLIASLAVVLFAIPLFLCLQGASLFGVVGIRVVLVLLGVAFVAPFHAWAQHLVPQDCRYAVISLGYALGSQFLGSPTAALALWCFKKTGMISSLSWYWIVLASASSLMIAMTLWSRDRRMKFTFLKRDSKRMNWYQ